MHAELLIIGSGGLAKETAQLARQINDNARRWPTIAYVASTADELGKALPFGDVRYVDDDVVRRTVRTDVVIAIGTPAARRRIASRLAQNPTLTFPNLIHPTVAVDESLVRIGQGNVIARGVAMTCDITIGDFNLFNLNVTVGHDATIGSFNVINPGSNISGATTIADECLLGTGCQVLDRCLIGSAITIGAGAVVTRSLEHPGVYVGIPARVRT